MEKPLKGTVLCCTSIAVEQRVANPTCNCCFKTASDLNQTQMAEAATQMGAEHKLDLTSDVTHLIVGDSNTAKYKYVAREREDIRVVKLAWVEAVRQAWMRGDDVNIQALEEKYRLPTFAELRICLTGFEDRKCLQLCSRPRLTAVSSHVEKPIAGGYFSQWRRISWGPHKRGHPSHCT